ncbi:NepR family anti-sigma factor [Ensifer adhaerens]|uniref:NepR family anti-sigma factor n=1 Tax=Ensifer adhaerens TaxID=106592 RepID=UPI0023A9E824|nr:NepR family anti-sigma factor [Ensifer adhaerens]WDZ77291.1 NepR family anti-sigma factor [Ensifer adhaerens]
MQNMDDGTERPEEQGNGLGTGAESSEARGLIGVSLKALYQALEQEPIPDLFIDLLERLEKAETTAAERAP